MHTLTENIRNTNGLLLMGKATSRVASCISYPYGSSPWGNMSPSSSQMFTCSAVGFTAGRDPQNYETPSFCKVLWHICKVLFKERKMLSSYLLWNINRSSPGKGGKGLEIYCLGMSADISKGGISLNLKLPQPLLFKHVLC